MPPKQCYFKEESGMIEKSFQQSLQDIKHSVLLDKICLIKSIAIVLPVLLDHEDDGSSLLIRTMLGCTNLRGSNLEPDMMMNICTTIPARHVMLAQVS